MPRRNAAVERGRTGRKRQRRLRDVIVGGSLQLGGEHLALRRGRVRSDQHSVAAGAVDFLDHELVEPLQHESEHFRFAATIGRHVLQQRLLLQVEFDEIGHVGVDRLVVGDAGADCIRDSHVARQIGAHQAGHTQNRVRIEDERIEKIVVDPAIDHVHALGPERRSHEYDVVGYEQITALDELDAELVGQEGMLVISRVERTRRQDHDRGFAVIAARRDRAQTGEQQVGVVVDRGHLMLGEQVRHQPHRHLAVLQHVGDAGRRARIVLEDVERVVAHAHDVDAGDLDPDVVWDPTSDHLRPVMRVAQDQLERNDVFFQDRARAVDVLQKEIERRDALDQPRLQPRPFGPRDHPRDDVERDQPLGRVLVAVDAEGDADAAKHEFGLRAARSEDFGRRLCEPACDMTIDRTCRVGSEAHFVEGQARRHLSPRSRPMPNT